jgi:hypothetical protein
MVVDPDQIIEIIEVQENALIVKKLDIIQEIAHNQKIIQIVVL